jgi:tRNA-uridine 2-sulfurtransferase
MSGGVDSTACALILSAHHRVEGFFMRLPHQRSAAQEERVRSIADRLGIALRVIDLHDAFEKEVLAPFAGEYFCGRTPNPCMVCNHRIKFGMFQQAILGAGMDKMATGHYSRLVTDGTRYRLYQGVDSSKDQSYFLSRLSQKQLATVLFPLGEQHKEDTYRLVEAQGFNDFRGLESQDVCFLENRQIGGYLAARSPRGDVSGLILDRSGRVLGKHNGLFHYTIGQRRGLGISAAQPLYVITLDNATNTVVVGSDDELNSNRLLVRDWHWLAEEPPSTHQAYTVRLRSTHQGGQARLLLDENGGEIHFEQAQRAITPGQFAVVYDGAELLGSAIIVGALPSQ